MKPDWLSYFVNVQVLKVSFLHSEEAYHLITQPVPDFSGEQIFGKDIAQEILRETGCHPFLIQALCSTLIDHINANYRDRAENQDIVLAMRRVLDLWGAAYFQDLWNRTDDTQQLCFTTLEVLGEANLSQIEQKSGLTREIAYQALDRLVNRDLVVTEQDRYRIAVPIQKKWVESNKSRTTPS
jgi:DNA-binding phage protein